MIAEVKRRYPGLPVFIVGTSRGTVSAAHLAAALHGEAAGAVLTSTLFFPTCARGRARRLRLVERQMPLLLVHHEDDGCGATPSKPSALRAAFRSSR